MGAGAQMMVNAVGDHFGVGFGSEAIAQALEIGTQRLVILDYPVVHDRDAVARDVWVGIVRGGHAVSRPAGMGDAHRTADRSRINRVLKHLHLADGPQARDPAAVDDGDAGRIVAAVLEAAQTFHEYGYRVALRDHTHDATH